MTNIKDPKKYAVIGTRPLRPDGADKVTGRALYGGDFEMSGLIYGKILRSPHAHARIKSINYDKAMALEGVLEVVTADDLPGNPDGNISISYKRGNILAKDKVLYVGHAVAAVAAKDQHIAEEALELIDVEYEVLSASLNVEQAMDKNAEIIHENTFMKEFGEMTTINNNIDEHFQHKVGNIDKGFEDADLVVEGKYSTVMVHQGYIEPHAATALWKSDGTLTVWNSTQGSFPDRDELSTILDIPISRIKVVPLEIGGGFGGKIPIYQEPVAALLSKKTGNPVKIIMTRKEVFESTGPTPGGYTKVKIGVKHDGKITAMKAELAFEAGGYPGSPVGMGSLCVFAAYKCDNQLVDGYDVIVNKPKTAAYRAPGSPNAAFATEQAMDEIAQKLDIDPIDLRLMNAVSEGDRRVDGPKFPVVGLKEVLETMKNSPQYRSKLDGPNKGRGIAVGYWFNVGLQSSCSINVNTDGSVNLIEGSTDIGGSRASIAMQAAETLEIPYESVNPSVVDTGTVGYTAVTGGSRTTFSTGYAAHLAAQDVKEQMIKRASEIWGVQHKSVTYSKGQFSSSADPALTMSFKELASQLEKTGGSIAGKGSINPKKVGGSFAGSICDLEIDPETGKSTILDFTAVQDAGKAIHPSYVEGQMQGGSVQGIGWALNEEYFYDKDGTMNNSSLLDYRMPTSLDLPEINAIIVEVPDPMHPYGVRGVGEANIVPPTAAVANAMNRASGERFYNLPMNPSAVVSKLNNNS
ncbi:MAG: xanthine dehydrogenase family protein molybdopterin-binding subunit [Dehalococcoidia bacterium]